LPEELRSETGVRFHANVFNGSERSIVRWRIDDGDWASMTKVLEPDPLYEETRLRENSVLGSEKPFAWRKLPKAADRCTHLWAATLSADLPIGRHVVTVEEVDMFGKVHLAQREFSVRKPLR